MTKNILFSFKKIEKHTVLAGQWGQVPILALPADAHVLEEKILNNLKYDLLKVLFQYEGKRLRTGPFKTI